MSLLISPMVVPIVVVGVSTYLFFAQIGLADTYTGLVLVHAALGAPFVLTTVLATLQGFNHNLVRASLSLGSGPVETFSASHCPSSPRGWCRGHCLPLPPRLTKWW